MKTIICVGLVSMYRENHPSASHHTTVAEPRLGVWGAYDTNSEEICRDKLAVIWCNWLCILKNGRWTMTSSFSTKTHYNEPRVVNALSVLNNFALDYFILFYLNDTSLKIKLKSLLPYIWNKNLNITQSTINFLRGESHNTHNKLNS